jgi:hypothetical protein
MTTPCTLFVRTGSTNLDDDGNEIPNEATVTTVCSLQQRTRSEAEGQVSDTLWTLFLPTGTAIDTDDAAIIGAARYEVVGQPWDATEGSPAVHHVEATLRRVAGAEDVL